VSGVFCVNLSAVRTFRSRVIEWYALHGDHWLPWRLRSDGWSILVAGVLLRNTTVKQVLRVYSELIEKYPSPAAMASASVEEVRELIRPLGMQYTRAPLLVELARTITTRYSGVVPCSLEELLSLPGVGEYTASEVLLAACGQPVPLIDRNFVRVVYRVLGVKPSKSNPYRDPEYYTLARSLVPRDVEGAEMFNYGVFDFARKVCKPRSPECHSCALRDICVKGCADTVRA
jgi:A/G-specific adenine glycosylase